MLPTRAILVSTAAAAALAGGFVALPADASPHASLAGAKPVAVSVVDNAFTPMNRTVKVGHVVKWTWRGNYGHNVTISGPKSYHSITKSTGTYQVKFTKVGTYHVRCTIHAASDGMKMTIKVVS